ncbi:hypothetical protein SAMN05880574_1486 [Chryseobacterium sp. RU37D]|nr:hypothetical protein SAMN05880574_1486 [Chryseobacterium sp. RU37D]
MKIFNCHTQNGKFIFTNKVFPTSKLEIPLKLPKCTVIDFEIKCSSEKKELLLKESRSGRILIYDVTDLSQNALEKLIEDIRKNIMMNSFYLQKHFIPGS